MKKSNKGQFLAAVTILVFAIGFAGCGAGNGQSSLSTQSGSYSLSVQWPDQGIPDKEKTIPDGSSTISVSITGQWISSPITTSIASGTTTLTISNVPVGNNIALIKALDASGNITAQRKESFTINENETTTADSVPLGIAITGSSSSPVFEPSVFNIPYGNYMYFQNWTDGSFTCVVNTNGSDVSLPITGASDSSGKWVFPDGKVQALQVCSYSISGKSAAGTAYAPAKNYASTKIFATDLYDAESIIVGKFGDIYIPDTKNNRILKYGSDYSLKATMSSYGTGTDNVYWPVGIGLDSNENIYVTESQNHRIHKFNSAGAHITMWGSYGTDNSKFKGPHGIAVDSANNVLYVMDINNYRIQKFNLNGGFISKWAMMNVGDGTIQGRGIIVASDGNLITTNFSLHRIEKYNSTGTQLGTFGSYGTNNGQFIRPYGIRQDKWGYIYVTNASNNRIEKFDSSFNFITNFGSYGTAQGEMDHPVGLAIDQNSNIIVIEWVNDRAQVFTPVQ